MIHFVVRPNQIFINPGWEPVDIVGTFTSSLFWALSLAENYLVFTSQIESVFTYEPATRDLHKGNSIIATDITLEEAEELVLADPSVKTMGIHPYHTVTAKDIICEIFVV